MATRQENEQRRTTMREALRGGLADGSLVPGTMLPPLRELAEKYGLSNNLAWLSVQELVDRGVLYTVPRVGTFVGKPRDQFDVYLLTFSGDPSDEKHLLSLQDGFEERVAQLGGVSLRLLEAEAAEHAKKGELPPLAGIHFGSKRGVDYDWWPAGVPTAQFGSLPENGGSTDKIHFDDTGGGAQAARHLLAMGHRRIAFLGLHTSAARPNVFFWSVEREMGWAGAMAAAGCEIGDLAFHPAASAQCRPDRDMDGIEQEEVAYKLAGETMVQRRDVTAVVAVNMHVANALMRALEGAKIPDQKWPAIICFDDVPSGGRSVVSYLRLPWDEVGRAAAQALWERKTGQVSGPGEQRVVPMRLIPRLTCRPDWVASALTRSRPHAIGGQVARVMERIGA